MGNFQSPLGEVMVGPVHTVDRGATLEEADRLLRRHGVSALAVGDDGGVLVGVVSRTDLLRAGDPEPGEALRLPDGQTVGSVMTTPALSLDVHDTLSKAARTMLDGRVHRVFVTRARDLVGVVSTRELMAAVYEQGTATPIGEIATRSVVKVRYDDPVALAIDRLDLANKHGLVVVQDDWPVGFFSQADALLARAHDGKTPVHDVMDPRILALPGRVSMARAAQQALAMNVRRMVLVEDGVAGILSGLDYARVMR